MKIIGERYRKIDTKKYANFKKKYLWVILVCNMVSWWGVTRERRQIFDPGSVEEHFWTKIFGLKTFVCQICWMFALKIFCVPNMHTFLFELFVCGLFWVVGGGLLLQLQIPSSCNRIKARSPKFRNSLVVANLHFLGHRLTCYWMIDKFTLSWWSNILMCRTHFKIIEW